MAKLGRLYDIAVEAGIEADARGRQGIDRVLESSRKDYEDLPDRRRWEFDSESLENPYSDTRILLGGRDTEVKKALVGIDIGVGEVLLAERLNQRGEGIDLLVAHHPEGRALADLPEVMSLQADIWAAQGVPVSFGDAVIGERMLEVRRRFHATNTEQTVMAAELLGLALFCCHTPADNSVTTYLQKSLDGLDQQATVGDVLDRLKEEPEYRTAVLQGNGPILYAGDEKRRAGKIMVDMTGGTEGPVVSLERLADAGVGTIVGMHMTEEHRKKAEELHLSIAIAGHLASDSLGMNLVLDRWEQEGVELVACSGFIRVSRN